LATIHEEVWPWLRNDLALALASKMLSSNISLHLSGASKGIAEEETPGGNIPHPATSTAFN